MGMFDIDDVIDANMGGRSPNQSSMSSSQRDRLEIRFLRANLEKTLMICEALWELLRERGKMTDEHLHEKLYEIDMRDGVLDGKNQRAISQCPNCKRNVSPRHATCLYCGHVIDDSIFSLNQ